MHIRVVAFVFMAGMIVPQAGYADDSAVAVARDHVAIARAFAALPDRETPVATPDALRRVRAVLDPLAEPGHQGGVPVEVRAQLAAASIDVALLDLPESPVQPARPTRTLTRVSGTSTPVAPADEPVSQRTVVLASAAPPPADRSIRVVPVAPDASSTNAPSDPTESASEVWQVPVREPRVTSRFGPRIDPITGAAGRMHRGTDYGAPTGTPVYATASGRVVLGGWCDRGTGNCIVIEHDHGWRSQYFHLSAVHTGAGERVVQGQHIGDIGSTGRSTGPHLHFQIGQGSEAVDPEGLFGRAVGATP